ncbi:hypothetical protein HN807_02005 [Candidatus Bathyarchaeota archaeon]|jgi:uncharacterized protein|nr:hypothetical protein [Candidatus Bathyarchaeota archaeon]MBT4319776.1 hypothetical protein [Candidatus Bathyarchaeota archaeon]MBT4424769.1 hypothetical protein [Candidatus Bathyarchaeota archaeon]MBT5642311.1 hypothetical protein [Candidatus Bathyarchaeota archaeon]MBT6605304.1 hypothetical protein [Candidatus Bathyarchaeota archaeon]
MTERKVSYFPEIDEKNTELTLKAVKKRAEESGIKNVVISSTRGGTALKALEYFKGFNVIVVTHVAGFKEPGKIEMNDETVQKIKDMGGKVLTTVHTFGGIASAINKKFSTLESPMLIANVLRMFGQGMKVVVEIVYMAADAGLLPMDEEVISIAGTGKGCDTAVLVKPAHSGNMFDLYVKEIIAKPTVRTY